MRIQLISTSLREESSSRALISMIGARLTAFGTDVTFTDIRELPAVLCDGRPSDQYPVAYRALRDSVSSAHAVVLSFPVHQYAPSGASKNLLEIIGSAMRGKLIGVVSASGSQRSLLAMGGLLASLVFDLRCLVVPRMVQVAPGDDEIEARVAEFSAELLRLAKAVSEPLSSVPKPEGAAATAGYRDGAGGLFDVEL